MLKSKEKELISELISMRHYDVSDIVATMIICAKDQNKSITNLQLQKYLYYIQGEHIKNTGELLFDEAFYAWNYGPVLYSVWKDYAKNSRYPIENIESGNVIEDATIKELIVQKTKELLEINIWTLVDKTHDEMPWKKAREKECDLIDNNDLIVEFSA